MATGTSINNLRMNVMSTSGIAGDGMARVSPPGMMASALGDPLVNLWNRRVASFDQYAQLFQPSWSRYWRYYRAWRQALSEPLDWWRSNEVIPTCFKIIETLVPKYVFGLFDSPDWFSVKGTEPTDEIWELAIGSLLHEKLEEMHVVPTALEAIKYAAIMGHVWGKVVWKEEFQTRQIMQPKMQLDPDLGVPTGTGYEKTTITDKITDRPDFQWVTLDRIKTAPDGSGLWFVEEMKTTLEQLQQENDRVKDLYKNLNLIQSSGSGSSFSSSPQFQEPQSTEGVPQWHVEQKDGNAVTLWQCWGWIPPQWRKESESEWRLTVIANRSTIIRDVDAPTPDGKPPYFPIKCIPIPGQLFGDSILRYIGPLADQQTRLANHRLDEVMLSVWGQLIIDASSGITNNEMVYQPGGALFVNGNPSEKVMVWPRQALHPEHYKEDEYRQEQAEHAAGATDIMQGINENDRSTAQEINAKLTQSGMRVTAQVLWFEETFKKPLLTRIYQWLQMRLPVESVQRVIGSDGIVYNVPLDITNIQIPIDIVVGGGLLGLSKNSRLQDFQEMIALLGNPSAAPYMRVDQILREYYRTKGFRNVDRFVKSQEEFLMDQMGGMAAGQPGLGSGQAGMDVGSNASGETSSTESMPMPAGQSSGGMG